MFCTKLCVVLFIACVYGKKDEVCFSVDRGTCGEGSVNDAFCTIGLADGRIRDKDITASSEWDPRHGAFGPHGARLNNQIALQGNVKSTGAWSARNNKIGEWIQVDLHKPTRLTGVITQGRPGPYSQWVTSFKASFGNYIDQLQMISESGKEKIFVGNNNAQDYSINKFPQPVFARYIRIYPQAWNHHMSLRMEFTICDLS